MTIHDLKPQAVWKHFHALNQIPRPSKHEEKVAAYLEQFGKDLGFNSFQDEVGNVIIRKPATPGMENRKCVLLQAHMDMVPQKNSDVKHDFLTDPIKTRVVGDLLYATGTTLGADDGLGVAIGMAVLESKDIKHGPIECLFTTDEETGMTGANALKPGFLKADTLINLDSEAEGELYVGCAGGVDVNAKFTYKRVPMPGKYAAKDIHITGLKGGHSGMEINQERGNSNKLMARILLPLMENMDARLISFQGGNMRNAIPREADAIIAIPESKMNEAEKFVNSLIADIKKELELSDAGLVIIMKDGAPGDCIVKDNGVNLVKAVMACPAGVAGMSLTMEGMVETSNNLSIVETNDYDANICTLVRGSNDSSKLAHAYTVKAVFELAGANVTLDGEYSGWQPNMESSILKLMQKKYKEVFGKEAKIKGIHAGLECGILGGIYPNWDMVSCGPTLMSPHSPDERVEIASVDKLWKLIKATLEDIPVK